MNPALMVHHIPESEKVLDYLIEIMTTNVAHPRRVMPLTITPQLNGPYDLKIDTPDRAWSWQYPRRRSR